MIVTSKELLKGITNKTSLTLSHGIGESEFSTDKKIDGDFLLYVGNIDFRINYDLLESLLKKFPEEKFLFIGNLLHYKSDSYRNIFEKKLYPNFEHHPPIHFKELKNYIAVAKACLAPMNLEVHGNNINHHKLLQYLAFGKPILSASFSDYDKNSLLLEYTSEADAITQLTQLIREGESKDVIDKRIKFAKQYRYSNLIEKIELFLSKK